MQAKLRLKLFVLALAAPCAAQAAPLYNITALPGASGLSPQAMNNSGQIVGNSQSGTAAKADTSGTTSLHPAGATNSYVYGINDAGAAAGQVDMNGRSRATVFSGGATTDIGALGGANTGSFGWGINLSGQVSGTSFLSGDSGAYRAFRYSAGVMSDLGTLGGVTSLGRGINDNGVVVGESDLAGGSSSHAFRHAGGAMIDLGSLGGAVSSAYAVNALGAVVGFSELAGNVITHAFLSAGGAMLDLGTLGGNSYAYDINDAGQVVGNASVGNGYNAFLWSGGVMRDLNALIDPSSGWHLTYAAAINEKGQIAAEGCRDGSCSALLLNLADPVVVGPTDVPEPASFSAVAAALGLAGVWRRRERSWRG